MANSYQEVQHLRRRMQEIVEGPSGPQEKRFRSMAIIKRMLEAVTPLLPASYRT